jgi:hypothetical protein
MQVMLCICALTLATVCLRWGGILGPPGLRETFKHLEGNKILISQLWTSNEESAAQRFCAGFALRFLLVMKRSYLDRDQERKRITT